MSWSTVSLPDAYWFQEGPGLRKWQFTGKGIKVLNVGNIMPDGSIDLSRTDRHISNEEFEQKYRHFGVDPGDLVIASSGISFDEDGFLRTKVGFIESEHLPLCMNTSTIRFKPKTEQSDLRYLKHWLQSFEFRQQVSQRVTGSAQLNFGPSHLKTMTISLPPPSEQKRIAAILDQADALCRLRQHSIDVLNALGQAIFREMFGGPIANERGWKVEKLKDLSTRICSGSTPKGGKKVYVDHGVFFLRSQNVWRRNIVLDDVVYIDKHTHQKMNKTSLKRGDILITKTGRINTENSSLGRAALFTGEDGSANINGHVYLIRTKADILEGFVEYILAMPEYRDYIRQVCVGGIDKRQINKEHLEEFPIIYPPVKEQEIFLRRLSQVEDQKKQTEAQLKRFNSLFLSLQQRAFKGEL